MKILRVISSVVAVAVFTASIAFTGAATASSATPSEVVSAHDGPLALAPHPSQVVTPTDAVERAKHQDASGLAKRVALIRQSKTLMALFDGATPDVTQQYLEFFAATATETQTLAIVNGAAGKHFIVAGTSDSPVVTLAEGAPTTTSDGTTANGFAAPNAMPTCWAGWAAAAAWFAGFGLLCWPIPGAGAIICDGVAFVLGMLPDFNAPCH